MIRTTCSSTCRAIKKCNIMSSVRYSRHTFQSCKLLRILPLQTGNWLRGRRKVTLPLSLFSRTITDWHQLFYLPSTLSLMLWRSRSIKGQLCYKLIKAFFSDDTIRALVTTNEGKVYSNGLALQLYANLSLEEIVEINKNVVALLRRILTFPMVTVAAINGVCIYTYSQKFS